LASPVPARLTSTEGRRFGLTLGPACFVISALLYWRGREGGAAFAGVLGGGLLLAALSVPRLLEPVRRAWMRLALAISKVTTPVVMGLVYILVISVIGCLGRLLGHNAIKRPAASPSYWVPYRNKRNRKDSMERQF
jgi:hypothetical protein